MRYGIELSGELHECYEQRGEDGSLGRPSSAHAYWCGLNVSNFDDRLAAG